jgi:AcrR family transcriptional regulator
MARYPARAEPPGRWKRRANARPEEILDAALAEFTDRGFDAARMEDVAKRAGLSKAGVYLYFPSKEALLKALIVAKIEPVAQQVRALSEHGRDDPLGALRVIAMAAGYKLRDPAIAAIPRLVVGLSGRFPEIADYYREHVVGIARDAFERLLASAMDKGQLRRIDLAAAARALIGPLLFEAMWLHVLRGESDSAPETVVQNYLDILLKGLEHP